MRHASGASGGDHRDRDGGGNRSGQFQIEPAAGAVLLDGGDEELAGSEVDRTFRPFDCIHVGALPAIVDVGLVRPVRPSNRLDRHHDGRRAEGARGLPDQLGPGDGRGIDRDLVRPGTQNAPDVVGAAQPATDGQRDEDLLGRALHDVQQAVAPVEARDDVHVDELVRSVLVVATREVLGPAQNPQAFEVNALDEIRALDVEARNDADVQRARSLVTLAVGHGHARPLVPRMLDFVQHALRAAAVVVSEELFHIRCPGLRIDFEVVERAPG